MEIWTLQVEISFCTIHTCGMLEMCFQKLTNCKTFSSKNGHPKSQSITLHFLLLRNVHLTNDAYFTDWQPTWQCNIAQKSSIISTHWSIRVRHHREMAICSVFGFLALINTKPYPIWHPGSQPWRALFVFFFISGSMCSLADKLSKEIHIDNDASWSCWFQH